MDYEHNDIVTKSVLGAAIIGSGDVIRVNFSPSAADSSKVISEKNYDELSAAVNDGKILIGVLAVIMGTDMVAAQYVSPISFSTGTFNVEFNGSVYAMRRNDVNTWAS